MSNDLERDTIDILVLRPMINRAARRWLNIVGPAAWLAESANSRDGFRRFLEERSGGFFSDAAIGDAVERAMGEAARRFGEIARAHADGSTSSPHIEPLN